MSEEPEEVLIQYRVTTKGWIHIYCIETDMANINAGCTSVGTFIYGKFYQFRDLHDVELFYANISLKELTFCMDMLCLMYYNHKHVICI